MPDRSPVRHSSMALLCAMMDPQGKEGLPWAVRDYRGLLEHLLTTDLAKELSGPSAAGGIVPAGITFGSLFADPAPDREHLHAAKAYAKRALEGGAETLPAEAARALYVAVIAKARVSGHRSLSRLSDADFQRTARWCLAQGWVPDCLHEALRRALPAGGIEDGGAGRARVR